MLPNGLELSCPAEAGRPSVILAHNGGPGAPTYPLARRVSFSELLGAPAGLGSPILPRYSETPEIGAIDAYGIEIMEEACLLVGASC